MHWCRRRPFAVTSRSSLVVGCGLDRRRVAIVDVQVVGSSEIESVVFEVYFEKTESLCSFGADQLPDRLEHKLAVVVLRRDEFLECLAVGCVFNALANRLDKQIRPIRVEEFRNRVQPVDEILRRLEVDPSRLSLPLML